ncbi:MAG: hypothetical protein GTO51_08730 [Candidatus Latescibacteria bacterium]|nr:hypothetical protein [Candidatus Latescibacterota bacterium]NIM22037.1 hypothetical protein [Candidatus Latescibacterota bacterium]NIM66055.1 hypothetical protein [Candidatus Latescibacterota bacterium]NIO02463.1 hypothetical protein [Candidatus Latescibacterota bacterium]NIO29374.1 hypothetical protein [Candidatus Latescibacterota bacterium]
MRNFIFFISLVLFLCPLWPDDAFSYNNTSLKWRTIETEHFDIHFHQDTQWTAREIARVAEEVYPHITGLYHYEPKGKIDVVVRDTDDYANGVAFYYDNKLEIWATNLEFYFRGTTQWLRNVFTHEFTHIISIQASMKFPQRIPAIYLQWIDFEKERRSDVLTGYPSHIASYPIAGAAMAPWFAEGVAQYMAPSKQYDCWDTHRDMILRCGVLEDDMLTYDEMGFFGKNGIRGEQVYDHGFGLVNYIASKYGPDAINNIAHELGSIRRLTIDGALKKVTGKPGSELYDEWKSAMHEQYSSVAAGIRENMRQGSVLAGDGYLSVFPAFSPDGERIAFLSNKGSDFGSTSLYIMDRSGEGRKHLKSGVNSCASFSPDGRKLLYSKKGKIDWYGSRVNDLYVYDIESEEEKRLTHGLRASDASFSPDGSDIVCVLNADGTHKIALVSGDGKSVREIFAGEKGTQFYAPQFSPDGAKILFGIFTRGTRDVAVINRDGGDFEYVLRTPNDEREAQWSRGGSCIVFSSDRTGVFNVYEMDLETGRVYQLTNVIGGAFMPALAERNGALAYSSYRANGYSIALLDTPSSPVAELGRDTYQIRTTPNDPCTTLKSAPLEVEKDVEADKVSEGNTHRILRHDAIGSDPATELAEEANPPEPGPYKRSFTPFQFFPRFIVYERTPRIGLFMASNEVLDKQNFFLGGSIGTNSEFDAFFLYELRQLYPTLFADIIRLREKYDDRAVFGNEVWELGLRYDLWQADLGLRLEFEEPFSITNRNVFSLFYTHGEYSVHIDAEIFNYGKLFARDNAGWKYFIGNDFTASYHYKSISRAVDSDINPRGGREFTIEYMRAYDELFTSGEFAYGFNPIFDKNNYNLYSLQWTEYVGLPYLRHTLQLKLYAAAIDTRVDDFFWIYIGGRDYLRGYTYYSIGGRKALLGSVTYRFPIWRRINKQFLHLYVRDLYGSIFYEAGNAWNEDKLKTTGYEKTIGYEARLLLGSFYTYPTSISVVAAYPLNEVIFNDPVFGELPIVHKKEWRYYVTVGFEF